MKVYFEGDKNVFAFKPIPKSKPGRKKKQSHFDRILNGTKDDLVDELERVITWARGLTEAEWRAIMNSSGGLKQFIRDTMENTVEK